MWFRKDLRVHDNPALWEASQRGNVIPIFIWSESEEEDYHGSEASLWWLHHSLVELERKLQELGLKLIYRSGKSLIEINKIINDTDATAIYYNHRDEPISMARDSKINEIMTAKGIAVRTFHSNLLRSPYDVKNKQGEPYKVFTSYYRNVLHQEVMRPVPSLTEMKVLKKTINSLSLEDLNLLPKIPWDKKFHSYWKPGERGAIQQYKQFVEDGLQYYKSGRDIPSGNNVSTLSPYLTWGNISVRAIWHSLEKKCSTNPTLENSIDAFKRQLIWRDFAYHQLIHFPTMNRKPLRSQFDHFPWVNKEEDFTRWKNGLTGYPLIDAGMRELYETGIIHNRVRMVVASFLIKHLLIPWQRGYEYFSETLVDYDVANNAMGWQWVAGCGVETAPYFRIFNPILQSKKFDKHGFYIRKWVPELAKLPSKHIHMPGEAPKEVLKDANIEIGSTYPKPMVDHVFARKRALAAFDQIKQTNST